MCKSYLFSSCNVRQHVTAPFLFFWCACTRLQVKSDEKNYTLVKRKKSEASNSIEKLLTHQDSKDTFFYHKKRTPFYLVQQFASSLKVNAKSTGICSLAWIIIFMDLIEIYYLQCKLFTLLFNPKLSFKLKIIHFCRYQSCIRYFLIG